LTCPFDTALFVISCLEECSLETDYDLNELIMNVRNVIDKLNVEFSMCVLSGYCLLSPASVQRALSFIDSNQSRFYAVDHTVNIPSNIYAWALKPSGKSVKIFSLKHNSTYDTGFHWTQCFYGHGGPSQSEKLLLKLKKAALLIRSGNFKIDTTGVRKLVDGMDYHMTDTTKPKLRSMLQDLTTINMLLSLI
jgi:hypothetical protein